jgi:hypothetical protein
MSAVSICTSITASSHNIPRICVGLLRQKCASVRTKRFVRIASVSFLAYRVSAGHGAIWSYRAASVIEYLSVK